MLFDFNMPVQLISGENCVEKNAEKLALGRHALIVTGRHSAKASGALDDVTAVLGKQGIAWTVFDKIAENPLASVCREGGGVARTCGADFVIGIGGGSAMDAAKAICAFAVIPEATEESIFAAPLPAGGYLPLLCIPTTAGTGSEANGSAVLTLPGGLVKKTFKHPPESCPRIAFLDPRYTYSLSENYTVSTALDALAHSIESYLSPKANEISMLFASYAAAAIWDVLFRGADSEGEKDAGGYTPVQRARLLYAAAAAGIAIGKTGTGFPHPLGYSITLSDGIPHGRACGAFEGKFIEYNLRDAEGAKRLNELAAKMGTTTDEMIALIPAKANVTLTLTREQCAEYVSRVTGAANYGNAMYKISDAEKIEIYEALFAR